MPRRKARRGSTSANAETDGGTQARRANTEFMQQIVRSMQEEFLTQPMGDESSAILAMGEFQRLKPPTFSGEPDPLIAEEWLARVTKILDTLQIVEDNLRVSFAVLQLQGDASKWWEYERNTVSGEWEAFTKAFLEKYFPEVTKDALREEFEKLIQKNMSVMQYEARFTTLSRFASELVENEDLKAKRFERGLKTTIRRPVEALKLCTYNDIVERAIIVEEALRNSRRIWESRSLSQDSQIENCSGKKAKVTSPSSQGSEKSSDPGKSLWEPGSCHHCGQLGHFRKECPLQEASEGVTESLQSHVLRRSLRRPTVCFHCGHMGHLKRDCPQTG
uniref:CCHC-type domain-containing protein n=1 Tax=Davidia involucrata TaxID=16924 RepID=A0A5B6ZSV1_DAVIN